MGWAAGPRNFMKNVAHASACRGALWAGASAHDPDGELKLAAAR